MNRKFRDKINCILANAYLSVIIKHQKDIQVEEVNNIVVTNQYCCTHTYTGS